MSNVNYDSETIEKTRNLSRFCIENRQIAWVMLLGTCLWGIFGYYSMPQRKDPEIQVNVAVVLVPWTGASAEKVEQLVTKKIEAKIADNKKVTKIESISRTGISVVYIELDDEVKDTGKEFDDIKLKLDTINDLPKDAGPINFVKDFGDTAALMLTVASPKAGEIEIAQRAAQIKAAIEKTRAAVSGKQNRFALVFNFPQSVPTKALRRTIDIFTGYTKEKGFAADLRVIEGVGFAAIDGTTTAKTDAQILGFLNGFIAEKLQSSEFHPDFWQPVVIRDTAEIKAKLAAVAGDKYSYREMDEFTELLEKTFKANPLVSKVKRSGLLNEAVYLLYSQERLASYGIQPSILGKVLQSRNIQTSGGTLNIEGKNVSIEPSGEFKSEREIGDVLIPTVSGQSVYLRDLADVGRGYESPARYLNYFNWRDHQGNWQRSRAVTLSVDMRSGEKIGHFGEEIDVLLDALKERLPEDLIFARTSDQPLQVEENVELFMSSLWEAIILVVIVALIGFWEWRSALLMALSIPLTLAMTFGMMYVLGIDLQQVSIASLIIALGLLVDDPVVAGDAIKRDLAEGLPARIAAWLGPTKLATAILYATITNIVAYLPFLMLPGGTGDFIYSLPVVMTCSLVASRVISMTFIPLLSYYLLRPKTETPVAERRRKGFAARYYRVGTWAIDNRWKVMAGAVVFLLAGGVFASRLKTSFFPKDNAYLSYVDVWLPQDAPLAATDETARQAEEIIREVIGEYGAQHPEDGKPREVLESLTTFVGGGGPRFWSSVSPELQQLNYAQIIIQVKDKHDTAHLIEPLQTALSQKIPGARIDVRRLETGKAVGIPVSIRLTGEETNTLRDSAQRLKDILEKTGMTERVRDDWGEESFNVRLQTDAERASIVGVTNEDVAVSSSSATRGRVLTYLREGDKQIPLIARLRMEERAGLEDLNNLYVYSSQSAQKVPLRQVSSSAYEMRTEKLRARNQFRTITVSAMPAPERMASEVMKAARADLQAFEANLAPGYKMEIGGEEEEQSKSFPNLAMVLAVSVVAIFLALVFQFKNAFKPLIVFAAVPFGMVGAILALWLMAIPFGFMAFLGMISLVGVIVSHIIVLFDFIEEKHHAGEPLREALLDAGIMRLRPVLITVGATVIALFPLAAHGGPLWEPLCYAQIGGLGVATFITLLLVPVLYAIFVIDLKLVKWDAPLESEPDEETEEETEYSAEETDEQSCEVGK
jgi:multidrug efflux pump subunit AcrB